MYTYNKNNETYTFSSDELDFENLLESEENNNESSIETNNEGHESENTHKKPTKIEVINGGNDLDISPVSEYIEIEKPKIQKRENIVIPEDNK